MAIRSNLGTSVIEVLPIDTIILSAPSDRHAVEQMTFHNTGSTSTTVDVYISPNSTTAAGERMAHYEIAGNESVEVVELIGQGLGNSEFVVALATASGINSKTTITEFTGAS